MKELKISIVIVNYNSGKHLRSCIESIKKNINHNYEVIIVDNNSNDGSMDNVCENNEISKIHNKKNLGFAKANNIGEKKSTGEIIHFLNPDCILDSKINEVYNKYIMSDMLIGVTELRYTNRKLQKSKYLVPNPANILKKVFFSKKTKYWYLGASIIIKKELFKRIGGWSENYFMYSEDLDLFHKINKLDLRVYEHKQSVFHVGEATTKKIWNNQQRFNQKEESLFFFFKNNFSIISYWFSFFIVFLYRMVFIPKIAMLQMKYLFKSENGN